MKLVKGLVIAGALAVGAFAITLSSVNAESVYTEIGTVETFSEDTETTVTTTYTVEEMLNYALQDEYLAQAEYQAIIDTYGEIKPFTNIVLAEQTHIDLLLPLFETYGYVVPENTAADSVVVPESITAAFATGIDAENANIAMYETFLAQDNLPDDVRAAFEYLVSASANHLAAFSKDRYSGTGQDVMNQIKNQWKKMGENANRSQSQSGDCTGDGTGTANQYKGTRGNN